jgi:hypothetical protein
LLAEIGTDSKREVNTAVLATAHKSDSPSLPNLLAHANTTPAQYTVIVSERVTDFLNTATDCNILYGA